MGGEWNKSRRAMKLLWATMTPEQKQQRIQKMLATRKINNEMRRAAKFMGRLEPVFTADTGTRGHTQTIVFDAGKKIQLTIEVI